VSLSDWTLDQTTQKVDVTALGDTNLVKVQGLPDVKGTLTGFWDDTYDTMFIGAVSANGINMYLYPSSDAPTKYWYGPAWLDASIKAGIAGAVTLSGNFEARGSWGHK